MKKLGIVNKFVFWGNWLAALLLVATFVVPYLAPSNFPKLSLASLAVSPLISLNILFLIYWLFQKWKKIWLSGTALLIAYFHFGPFVEFSSEGDPTEYRNTLSVLSYNVRLFNAYEKDVDTIEVANVISELIEKKQPDVICVQEYYEPNSADFSDYPYSFIHFRENHKMGHAIFSKFPLENKGAFNFKDSHNNSIYADVVKDNERIRVYNLHLQSHGILPNMEYLQGGESDQLRTRMSAVFVKQETQVDQILKHKATSPYPVLLCGDINNTRFSYIYGKLKDGMNDAFLDKGNGIGTTFKFDFYPIRIDYIFTSPSLEVVSFEAMDDSFSDHKPISTTIGWPAIGED